MVNPEIIDIVRQYLAALPAIGINPTGAILFGSQARSNTHEWSDIDVVIIAPEFDSPRPIPWATMTRFWDVAQKIDPRLEPIPCGAKEWQQPRARAVLSYAEAEGLEIAA